MGGGILTHTIGTGSMSSPTLGLAFAIDQANQPLWPHSNPHTNRLRLTTNTLERTNVEI